VQEKARKSDHAKYTADCRNSTKRCGENKRRCFHRARLIPRPLVIIKREIRVEFIVIGGMQKGLT